MRGTGYILSFDLVGPHGVVVHHVAVALLLLGADGPAAFRQQGHKAAVVGLLHRVRRGQGVGQLLRQLPQQLQPPVLPQDPAIVQGQQHRPGCGAQHKGIGHRPQRQLVQGEGGGEDAAEQEKRQQRPAPLPQISGQHGPHPTI